MVSAGLLNGATYSRGSAFSFVLARGRARQVLPKTATSYIARLHRTAMSHRGAWPPDASFDGFRGV